MRILLVEDEREYSRALREMLARRCYAVDAVYTGLDGLDYALTGNYDAIVLDIMLPGMDGITVLRRLREQGLATPVLVLTARGQMGERIAGYDAGADDYLAKPFNTTELLSRVRALLRRRGGYSPDVLTLGNASLDCAAYELRGPLGGIRLGGKEFQLAELLFRSREKVVPTERMLDGIWGWDAGADSGVVWTNVSFLRKKLLSVGANVEIKSVRGVGYRLTERGEARV